MAAMALTCACFHADSFALAAAEPACIGSNGNGSVFICRLHKAIPTLLIHVVDEGEARHDMSQLRPKLEGIAAEAAAQGIERDSFEFDLYTLRLLWQRVAGSPKAYARHLWSNFSYFWIEPPVVWPDSVYNGHWRFPNGYRHAPGFADHARLHSILVVMGLVSLLLLYWQSPAGGFLSHIVPTLLRAVPHHVRGAAPIQRARNSACAGRGGGVPYASGCCDQGEACKP